MIGLGLGLGLTGQNGPSGPSYGPELISNGDFSAGGTGWPANAGWTFSGGTANCDGSGGANCFQFGVLPTGQLCRITIDVARTSGTVQIAFGSVLVATINASGSYAFTGTPDSDDTLAIKSKADDGFLGSVDNVSVKRVL